MVETNKMKFLCEPKAADELDDREVQAKARAAAEWCANATDHEMKQGVSRVPIC